jgi:hypothetical protein
MMRRQKFLFRGDSECPKIVSLFVQEFVNYLSKCDFIIGPLSYVTTAELVFWGVLPCSLIDS